MVGRTWIALSIAGSLAAGAQACSSGSITGAGQRADASNPDTGSDSEIAEASGPDAMGSDDASVDATVDASSADDGAVGSAEYDVVLPGVPDGALWVGSADCGMGEVAATFMNVPAYCQPPDAAAWGFYQCDELANRFMRDAFQHPEVDNVATQPASTICQNVANNPAYSVWGPGYGITIGRVPQPGDLIVYNSENGSPGHVAVIAGFSDPTTIVLVQQNTAGVGKVRWDATTFFFGANSQAECWVHPEPSPPAPLPSGPPCGCIAPGPACGLAVVDYAWWYGCTASVLEAGVDYQALYDCDGGIFTKQQVCANGCLTLSVFDAGGSCLP
jgi:hypothetical protein